MVTTTTWKPKHTQKESQPLADGNSKKIMSNEVKPTTEIVMSKEKPPSDPGSNRNNGIEVAKFRQPTHKLQDETQVTSISPGSHPHPGSHRVSNGSATKALTN
ncbi:unnamed protein product [Ilex paraguariensis]|uniref:Uncharacterized protein n=1 Tax=Ilex paraguariensis TaxID=185542 RepID=A0ABC8RW32_9AQUA